MPREKSFTKMIPKIYKCNAENMGLFFTIKAQLQLFPTMTIEQGINNFRKLVGITIDDWDDESMRATYNRLQREYYKGQKCEHTKTDKGTAGA
jgi:hypothetical protein